jgi:hypothetical protein
LDRATREKASLDLSVKGTVSFRASSAVLIAITTWLPRQIQLRLQLQDAEIIAARSELPLIPTLRHNGACVS